MSSGDRQAMLGPLCRYAAPWIAHHRTDSPDLAWVRASFGHPPCVHNFEPRQLPHSVGALFFPAAVDDRWPRVAANPVSYYAATEPNSLDDTHRFAYRPRVLGGAALPRHRSSEIRLLEEAPKARPLIPYCAQQTLGGCRAISSYWPIRIRRWAIRAD
jgi:hypothetical protein